MEPIGEVFLYETSTQGEISVNWETQIFSPQITIIFYSLFNNK